MPFSSCLCDRATSSTTCPPSIDRNCCSVNVIKSLGSVDRCYATLSDSVAIQRLARSLSRLLLSRMLSILPIEHTGSFIMEFWCFILQSYLRGVVQGFCESLLGASVAFPEHTTNNRARCFVRHMFRKIRVNERFLRRASEHDNDVIATIEI